ncbi:MAG: hypothetical protein KAX48_03720, partial [Aeromonas sp.]|nr:hypothetical protein [Aeromonas sp.]
ERNVIEFIIYPMGRSQTLPAQKRDCKRDYSAGFVRPAATGVLICAILKTTRGGLTMHRLMVFWTYDIIQAISFAPTSLE